mmetsp:Transcript_17676/g.38528  ORF Transcript_17676/g.38528 Transcript_17676/m.38528 type:complete len:258 (+) Transcript_17676:259-1032(+)
MPGLHYSLGLVLGIMWNVGTCMEERSNTVPTISTDHTAFIFLCNTFNRFAQIAVQCSGSNHGHGGCQTFKRRSHQALPISVHLSDAKSFIQITVIATSIVCCHVQVDNVSILNFPKVGNAVTNHFIDTGTDTFWEIVIIQRRRITVAFHTSIVHNAINFIRGHAHAQRLSSHIQHFAPHLAGVSEARNFFRAVQFRVGINPNVRLTGLVALFGIGNTGGVVGVIGASNPRRYHARRAQQSRPQRSGKVVAICPVGQG